MSKTKKEVKKQSKAKPEKVETTENVEMEMEIVQEERLVQEETVHKDTTLTPVSREEIFLKSVDPFAFVGKGTSQYVNHRTKVIVSGLASLQLEESERVQELFKATNFEQHFFKAFHPTGSLSAFASESVEERRASSKLMAPVLCSSILKMAGEKKRDLPASVLEALLCSGHLTVYRSDLVDRVLQCVKSKGTGSALLRALLHSMNDFSDAELVKLIVFVLESEQYFTYASEIDLFLMKLMVMPKSPLLLKTYLMALSDKLILSFLSRIEGLLKKPACTGARQMVLFEWLSVCIDSQYPLCVMKPEFIQRLASINEFIQEQHSFDAELTGLAGLLKTLTKKEDIMRYLPKRESVVTGNAHYSIELTDL